jgi:Fe-S oxidoreductase
LITSGPWALCFCLVMPRQSLCCGRPLYDYGMLNLAQKLLQQILTALKPAIQRGIPVVVLEPSCASVFRDELTDLLHGNEDAKLLQQQTYLLSEFLERKVKDYQPSQLKRKAIVHGHCHHKSTLKFDDEESVLKKTGLDYQILDSGCCGMAGAFGYEADHYEVGLKCGERVLLPQVRSAPGDALIISDGFSCREQILQETDRRALHLSQVLQMGLKEGPAGPIEGFPEQRYATPEKTGALPVSILLAGSTLVGAGLWWTLRAKR